MDAAGDHRTGCLAPLGEPGVETTGRVLVVVGVLDLTLGSSPMVAPHQNSWIIHAATLEQAKKEPAQQPNRGEQAEKSRQQAGNRSPRPTGSQKQARNGMIHGGSRLLAPVSSDLEPVHGTPEAVHATPEAVQALRRLFGLSGSCSSTLWPADPHVAFGTV